MADSKSLSLKKLFQTARNIFARSNPVAGAVSSAYNAVNTPLNVDLERFRQPYNKAVATLRQPVSFAPQVKQFEQKLLNSPVGIPGRVVKGYSDALRENITRAGQAYGENTRLLNEGAPLKARVKPLAMGGWSTAKALSQVVPGGGIASTIPGAINAGIAGIQRQDMANAFGRGLAEYQGWRPVLDVTNPVTSKIASGAVRQLTNKAVSRAGKLPFNQLVASQVAQRGVSGIGNVIEDEILARLDQVKRTNADRVGSFVLGAAMSGNQELLNNTDFKGIAKKLGTTPDKVKEVYENQLARRVTITDNTGKTRVIDGLDKQGASEWSAYAESMGFKWKMDIGNGSPGRIGDTPKPPTDPTEALKVEDYVLPKDIPVYQEAKAIGAKRIAPDRIPHQQLTPDAGIKALVDKQKQRLQNNANSWATATKKIDDLIKKYGEKLPQRTEKNIQTYPGLMDDYRTYQEYKKYAWQPKNLTDVKTQFERRANVTNAQWTPEAEAKALESAKKDYIELIKSDISKGYKYPDSVLDFDRSFRIAENNRARYEKGLRTSFSSDDQRIVIEDIDKIGGGMKRQDGKPITDSQKETIKRGVVDFANTMGIDIARLAKDDRWVYAHLNGKNPFLTAMAGGLYRKGANNVSISVSGSETFKKVVDGKEVFDRVHTTMAHELGHALDGKADKRLFDSQTIWSLRNNFNPIEWMPRGDKYWKSQSEITARMIEQYNAVKKGNTNLFDREGYWKKDVYEQIIEPAVERAINTHFADYKLQTPLELPKSQLTDLYNQAKGVTQAQPGKVQLKPKIQTEKPAIAPGVVDTQQPSLSQGTQKVKLNQPQTKVAVQQPGVENKKALDDIIAEGRKSIGATNGNKDKKSVRQVLSEAYTQWVDRYNPLTQASRQAKKALKVKGAELRPEYDPEYLVRRLTGAGGIADYRFNTELKPTIDAIDQAGIPKLDMDTYLAHKRMAGFGDVGREVYGTDPAKSRQITRALEAKYPEISRLADQLYRYQDQGLQELANAGFLSKEAVDAMRSQNPDYAPLYRVMDEMNDYLGLPTRKTMQGSNPVVRIKGSTKQIDSPLENIIGNTFSQRAAIEKNRVAQSIVGLQDITDMGFEKVAKSGNDTITAWNNGKKEFWRVGTDIADTSKGLNEENMNMVLKILQAPASLLRQGATGRNPEFMVPNVIRDQLDAGITSKYGYIPFVDYFSGLRSMLSNDEYYQRWANSGANIDLGELSGRKSIQQLFDEKKTKRSLFRWLGDALDVMGKYSEQPTRVGLFKKAYQKTGNELLAAMESRDATVDFARMGSKMKVANSIIPFLNVGVQGFDKLARSTKNQPGKVALNLALYAAIPAATTTLWNLMNYKDEYQELPQYTKDSNFIIVTGRNKNGKVNYISIPKGNVVPIVANPVTSFLEYLSDANNQTFSQLATQLITETLPVVEGGQTPGEVALKTFGSNLPQMIKPAAESLLNKSFYKYNQNKDETKEIVPYYLKNKQPYQQSYEFTPELYKKIGALLNVSPLQVQNVAEGYLAGYAKIPANIVDIMTDVSNGKEIDKNQIPLMRRFFGETYESYPQKETYKQPTPSVMERLTGKVSASDGTVETNPDVIKQKMEQRPDLITPEEIATYYESRVTKPTSTSEYQQKMYEKDIWSQVSNINQRDSLTQQQQDAAAIALLEKIGVSAEDYKYYTVAKQTNELKSLYAEEELTKLIATGASREEIYNWLVDNRREVNGNQVLTSGVIGDLVDKNIISYTDGQALKNLTVSGTGAKRSVTKKTSSKKPKIFKPTIKSIKAPKVKTTKAITFTPPKITRVKINKPKKTLIRRIS